MVAYYLRGTIGIRTCDQDKNLYITLFLLTIFRPDYYVPRFCEYTVSSAWIET